MVETGIAAGSRLSADAAARVLARGGNAVDAVVAAMLASSAADAAITSLAGGGVMLVSERGRAPVVLDFFTDVPGRGLDRSSRSSGRGRDFAEVSIEFETGGVRQGFWVGRGAAAVPGALPGLAAALARWGSLPMRDVARPAIDALEGGVELDEYQASCFRVVAPILSYRDAVRALFCAADGSPLGAGAVFRNTALACFLDAWSARPERAYREIAESAIAREFGVDAGGLVTRADLDAYAPVFREPELGAYHGARVATNPAPSSGGRWVLRTLELFGAIGLAGAANSAERYRLLAAVFRAVSEARARHGDLIDRQDAPAILRAALDRVPGAAPPRGDREERAPGNTAHVSVADRHGTLAGATLSHGEGCGHLIGATGLHMNNMLGERDLLPAGFDSARAGERLSTMMAPAFVETADGRRSVLGAGGSNRIRTALAQVIDRIVRGDEAQSAVDAARLHVEDGVLSAETWAMKDGGASLESAARIVDRVQRFDARSLFFGGVHIAGIDAEGRYFAAADARRGGVVRRAEG